MSQMKRTKNTAPIDAPDILPTLLGVCGLPATSDVQGIDWSPYIRGEKELTGEETAFINLPVTFSESMKAGIKPYRGIRDNRYTYVRATDGPWLLYDSQEDPYQMKNLINLPEHKELQDKLETRLQERLAGVGDEFLDEKIYIERAGYEHQRELNNVRGKGWVDPWVTQDVDNV